MPLVPLPLRGGPGRLRAPRRRAAVALGAALLFGPLFPRPALALQPLAELLAAADARNPDAVEAVALAAQRDAEARAALGRLLPSFTARGVYSRNQYEVSAQLPVAGETRTLVIQPQDQWDAFLQLDVPLVDAAAYARWQAQKAGAASASASEEVARLELRKRVVRAYYTVVGAAAFVRASQGSLALAERNRDLVRVRREAQLVSELDAQRANANVERARQDLADAELLLALAERSLETLTRVTPEPTTVPLEESLDEEEPLERWLAVSPRSLAQGKAAEAQVQAAEAGHTASRLALLPTLGASAQQRFTNATGFLGRDAYWTLGATLTFHLDYATIATQSAQRAAADAARAREDRALRAAQDDIVDAWQRVRAGIPKCRAARAEEVAALRAARLAEDRYASGAATQLDVTQAQRDAASAQAGSIRASAELASARAVLRLAAGRPLPPTPSREP